MRPLVKEDILRVEEAVPPHLHAWRPARAGEDTRAAAPCAPTG